MTRYLGCEWKNANAICRLEVLYSNVDSITNKIDEIKAVMALKPEEDVFAFTEVKPKRTSTPLTRRKYRYLVSNFSQALQRVIIYTRASLQVGTFHINSEHKSWVEHVWVTIKLHDSQLVKGCLYRSPSAPCQVRSIKPLTSSVDQVMRTTNENVVITGDLNLPRVQ